MNPYALALGLAAMAASATEPAHAQAPATGQPAGPSARPPLLMPGDGQPAPRLLATFGHPQPDRALAVVLLGDAPAMTVRVGQAIGDFDIHAINHDHIVVARGTQRFTVPLTGRPRSARAVTQRPAGTARGTSPPATTTSGGGATLAADGIADVRAACGDPTLLASLPAAQREELAALGLCAAP